MDLVDLAAVIINCSLPQTKLLVVLQNLAPAIIIIILLYFMKCMNIVYTVYVKIFAGQKFCQA